MLGRGLGGAGRRCGNGCGVTRPPRAGRGNRCSFCSHNTAFVCPPAAGAMRWLRWGGGNAASPAGTPPSPGSTINSTLLLSGDADPRMCDMTWVLLPFHNQKPPQLKAVLGTRHSEVVLRVRQRWVTHREVTNKRPMGKTRTTAGSSSLCPPPPGSSFLPLGPTQSAAVPDCVSLVPHFTPKRPRFGCQRCALLCNPMGNCQPEIRPLCRGAVQQCQSSPPSSPAGM